MTTRINQIAALESNTNQEKDKEIGTREENKREKRGKKEEKRKKKIGFCSKAFFCYINKLFDRRSSKIFKERDLFKMAPQQKSEFLAKSLIGYFKKNQEKGFLGIFLRYAIKHFSYSIILIFIGNLLQLVGPILLQRYIKVMNSKEDNGEFAQQAVIISIVAFIYYLLQGMILNNGILFSNKISTMINQSVRLLIYEKMYKMKEEYKFVFDDGAITSLIVVDAIALQNWLGVIPHIVSTPLLLVIAMSYILAIIGWEAIISVFMLILISILLFFVSGKQVHLQGRMVELLDEKSQILTEYLKECKNVRYEGLQEIYEERIVSNRDKEINVMFKRHLYLFLIEILFFVLPVILSVSVFPLYIYRSDDEDGDSLNQIFALITIFNILRGPLKYVYQAVIEYPRSKNASYRLKIFLSYVEEIESRKDIRSPLKEGEIFMKGCCFGIKLERAKKVALLYKNVSITSSSKKFKELEEKIHLFDTKSETVLHDINFRVTPGEKICIVGSNTNDKSYFLKAILGSIDLDKGIFKTKGKVSYLPRSPFMLNTTIRRNIILQGEYNREKYHEILRITGLDIDLGSFKGGDLTEIVEFGKNMSKIQLKKIGLARALYSDSDIYLIDEIFKGIINSDALYIYEIGFNQILKEKTLIYVTDNIEFIRKADRILVLDKGEIKETGSYFTLSSDEKSIFYNLFCLEGQYGSNARRKMKRRTYKMISRLTKLSNYSVLSQPRVNTETSEETELRNKFKKISSVSDENYKKALLRGKTMMVEKKTIGSVDWKTWKFYLTNNKVCLFITSLACFFTLTMGLIGSDWFLGVWSIHKYDITETTYFRIYMGLISTIALNMLLRGLIFTKYTKKSSKEIHNSLMRNILRADYLWLNATPIGRIMNRCFRDQQDVDVLLPNSLSQAIQHATHILGSVILITITSPISGVLIAIMIFILFMIIRKFLRTNTEMRRILARRRGKIVSYFSEMYQGNLELSSFGYRKKMREKFCKLNDDYQNSMIHESTLSQKWLSVRTSFIGSACLFCVLIGSSSRMMLSSRKDKFELNLALSWCMSIVNLLWVTSLNITKTGSLMSSVERVKEYCEEIPQIDDHMLHGRGALSCLSEADVLQRSFKFCKSSLGERSTTRGNLIELESRIHDIERAVLINPPEKSLVDIRGLCMEYEKKDKDAFKLINFSLKLQRGEKIAIIGSSGSGKHTIFNFLTKLIRNSRYNKAKIMGIDHEKYTPKDLRDRMMYLNGNPTLLKGSLIQNIDPFKQYKLHDVIRAFTYLDIWNFFLNGVTKRAAFDVKFKSEEAISQKVRSLLKLTALNIRNGLLKQRKNTVTSAVMNDELVKKDSTNSLKIQKTEGNEEDSTQININKDINKDVNRILTLEADDNDSSQDLNSNLSDDFPEEQAIVPAFMNDIHTVMEEDDEYNSFFTYNTKNIKSISNRNKHGKDVKNPSRFASKVVPGSPSPLKHFMRLPLKRMRSDQGSAKLIKKSRFSQGPSTFGGKSIADAKKSRFFRMGSQKEEEESKEEDINIRSPANHSSQESGGSNSFSSFGEGEIMIGEEDVVSITKKERNHDLIEIRPLDLDSFNQSLASKKGASLKMSSNFDIYDLDNDDWLNNLPMKPKKKPKNELISLKELGMDMPKKRKSRLKLLKKTKSILIKDDPNEDEKLMDTLNSLVFDNKIIEKKKEESDSSLEQIEGKGSLELDNDLNEIVVGGQEIKIETSEPLSIKESEASFLKKSSLMKNPLLSKIKSEIKKDRNIEDSIGVISQSDSDQVVSRIDNLSSNDTKSKNKLSGIDKNSSLFVSNIFTKNSKERKSSNTEIEDFFNSKSKGQESVPITPIISRTPSEVKLTLSSSLPFNSLLNVPKINYHKKQNLTHAISKRANVSQKQIRIDVPDKLKRVSSFRMKGSPLQKKSRFQNMVVRTTTKQSDNSSDSSSQENPMKDLEGMMEEADAKTRFDDNKKNMEMISLRAKRKAELRKSSKISRVSGKTSLSRMNSSITSGVISAEEDSLTDEMNMPVDLEDSPLGPSPINQRLRKRLEKLRTKKEINRSLDCSFMYKAQYVENVDVGLISSELEPFVKFKLENLTDKDTVTFKAKLNSDVDYSGINYSVKETKLIKLATALLSNPDILLFDQEALVIEDLFENALFDVVKSNFERSGMLGIIHDVNYLTYFDKVVCMRNGSMQESGDILTLLKNQDSYLCKNLIRNEGVRSNLIEIFEEMEGRKGSEVHDVFSKNEFG